MKTVVLVGGAIMHEGKLLLLKRTATKKFLPGYYDLPGGKIEPGEDPDSAIIREIKEETGLDVEPIRPYNVWSVTLEFKNEKEHCVEIDYLVRVLKIDSIKLSEKEHSEFCWVDAKNIPDKLTPELRKTIIRAFENQ